MLGSRKQIGLWRGDNVIWHEAQQAHRTNLQTRPGFRRGSVELEPGITVIGDGEELEFDIDNAPNQPVGRSHHDRF